MHKFFYILIIGMVFSLLSCTNSHIGKYVTNLDSPKICKGAHYETCNILMPHFDFSFDVKKGDVPNEYIVNGTAKYNVATIITKYRSGSFNLYLVRGSKIVDVIPFMLQGRLAEDQNMKFKFKTEEIFTSLMIDYRLEVSEV
jgi:hypothetical protein